MKDYYFRTEKLSVGYHKKALIKEIEISLHKGEILTLIGPNGAGKSTILKSIARQLSCIGGNVFLEDKNLFQMTGEEVSKSMAVVLTQRLRTEMMTCEDVVASGRYPYTGKFGFLSKEDHIKVEEAMALVRVTDLKDQDFTKVSDGQRQRVMLARAICQEPEIIILDEPTSFLDVKYKLEFLSVLQDLRRRKGLTVIMSLHELELAEKVSDKILTIKGDKVDRFGTPEEIFTKGYLTELFQITQGSFDEQTGTMELEAVKENAAIPENVTETKSKTGSVFVIAGGGCGKNVYRRLQRQGISFATGILYENDIDWQLARLLAVEVITEKPFCEISD